MLSDSTSINGSKEISSKETEEVGTEEAESINISEKNDDDDSDVGTDERAIDDEFEDLILPKSERNVPLRTHKQKGQKRSKSAAIYIRTLEDRVHWLEENVEQLLGSLGSVGSKKESEYDT